MRNLTFAVVGAALVAFVAGPASAQDTSTAVGTKGVQLLTETNSYVPIMAASIHMAQQPAITARSAHLAVHRLYLDGFGRWLRRGVLVLRRAQG